MSMPRLAAVVNGQVNVEMLNQSSRVCVSEPAPIEASELVKELRLQVRVRHPHNSWERRESFIASVRSVRQAQ